MNINPKQEKQKRKFDSCKIPKNPLWKPMNSQIEIIRQRKTNYKRPPVKKIFYN